MLRATPTTVTLVVAVDRLNDVAVPSQPRIGLVQHSVVSGEEIGRVWLDGSCLQDTRRGDYGRSYRNHPPAQGPRGAAMGSAGGELLRVRSGDTHRVPWA